MKKLHALRTAILAAPLKIPADHVLTFAEKGTVLSRRGEDDANKAFTVSYTAHLIVTDATCAPQDLFFIVADWLHDACPDAPEDAIRFNVDVIDTKKADISLAVDISEIVAAPVSEAGTRVEPTNDPKMADLDMGSFADGLPDAPP